MACAANTNFHNKYRTTSDSMDTIKRDKLIISRLNRSFGKCYLDCGATIVDTHISFLLGIWLLHTYCNMDKHTLNISSILQLVREIGDPDTVARDTRSRLPDFMCNMDEIHKDCFIEGVRHGVSLTCQSVCSAASGGVFPDSLPLITNKDLWDDVLQRNDQPSVSNRPFSLESAVCAASVIDQRMLFPHLCPCLLVLLMQGVQALM